MPKCLVPRCASKFSMCKNKRKISFFSIPNASKNPKKWGTAKQWLTFCDLDINDFQFGMQHKIICEKHFLPGDLELLDKKVFPHGFRGHHPKRVKFGAIPQIHDVGDIPDPPTPEAAYSEEEEGERDLMKEEEAATSDSARYVNDFTPEPLDKPLSEERQVASDLARWPPDIKIPLEDLNELLTCGICKGYFYNAATITECLHTFCKGCLVNHFNTRLHCPVCEVLVHPSDPLVNVKLDTTMQDIVYKVFPQKRKEDLHEEINFYVSRGLNPPERKTVTQQEPLKIKMISLRLDYAGTTPSLQSHKSLSKTYLRIPNNVTVGQIAEFLKIKMCLASGSQAAMFVNCFMLNEALTVNRLQDIFGNQIHDMYTDIIFLQYGIIPKADYFDKGLLISTKYL